jgi:restriction endonuclease S subunit
VRIPNSNAKEFKLAKKGSVLLCAEGGSAGRKMAILEKDTFFGNKLFCFECNNKLDGKYLFYYLQGPVFQDLFKISITGLIGGVSLEKVRNLPILLPSLDRQRKIVEKLDYALRKIDVLEENFELCDKKTSELLQSLLDKVFADSDFVGESSNPSAHQGTAMTKFLRLGELAEVGAGNSAPQNKALFEGGTLPFVRTSDVGIIHIGSIKSSRDLLTPEGAKGLKLFSAGTILFPKSGASTFLNHRVILTSPAYVSSHLATIKANAEIALDRYIYYFLQTVDARDLCQDQTYPSLNRDQIAGIKVPLPSLDEQQKIIEKLDGAFAEIELQKARLRVENDYVVALRQSLLSSAFTQDEEVA